MSIKSMGSKNKLVVDVNELENELLKVLDRDYDIKPEDINELHFRLVDRAIKLTTYKVPPIYTIKTEFICYMNPED